MHPTEQLAARREARKPHRRGQHHLIYGTWILEDELDEAWVWFRTALTDAMRYRAALAEILEFAEAHSGDIYALESVADMAHDQLFREVTDG